MAILIGTKCDNLNPLKLGYPIFRQTLKGINACLDTEIGVCQRSSRWSYIRPVVQYIYDYVQYYIAYLHIRYAEILYHYIILHNYIVAYDII